MSNLRWPPVIARATEIVLSYDTGVTLRQLFYRLVSAQILPNTMNVYKSLSDRTAALRRQGLFPDLVEAGRPIHQLPCWDSPADAWADWTENYWRVDRTAGQDVNLWVATEKSGLVRQLSSWFGDLDVPIVAFSGYASVTLEKDAASRVDADGRPAVLLYAGDFDPTGEDIDRVFVENTACWAKVIRVALNADQVDDYGLPENPGKTTDSRAKAFAARHGRLCQVEMDALDPTDLRALFQDAIDPFWDTSAYDRAMAREGEGRADLERLAGGLR